MSEAAKTTSRKKPKRQSAGKSGSPRLPPAPRTIPSGRWRQLRTELLADHPKPSRLEVELINRLVLNLMYADHLLEIAGEQPIVTGSTGQQSDHPGFRVAARCDSTAIAIAKQLQSGRSAGEQADPEGKSAEEKVADELAARRAAKRQAATG